MPKGEDVLDTKTIMLIIALGGTNALQYLGISAPAQNTEAETMATAEFMSEQLDKCMTDLRDCIKTCQP
jgi:hypothetical protein